MDGLDVVQKMTELYTTPQSLPNSAVSDDHVRRRRNFWLRAIWISVVGVIVPPMFGLIGTVFGMVRAFGNLSQTVETDHEAMARNISVSLLSTAWGLVISTIAFIVLIGVSVRFFTLPKVVTPHPQTDMHNKS
ncbi:MAG: MotA/TolQ/ExbB proton channel family protein [Pedosphaera sp.]|nr:MotA/TolQ/ExbB proton channel family protein [Pedosphaera sp.]